MVDLLLDAGAAVDARMADGTTALILAADKGRLDNIACLLAHHANVHIADRNGDSALSIARSSRARNATTPFYHDGSPDFWPHIVKMLEQAEAR